MEEKIEYLEKTIKDLIINKKYHDLRKLLDEENEADLAEVFETVAPNIDIDILKVDVDKFPDIAKEYAIMSIPTLFLFENNQIKKTHTGYLNPNELINFLK